MAARPRNEHSSTAPFFLHGYTCEMFVKRPLLTLFGALLVLGAGVMAFSEWEFFDFPALAHLARDQQRSSLQTVDTLEALVERAEARDVDDAGGHFAAMGAAGGWAA